MEAVREVSRFKQDFPALEDRVYLNTGAEGIPAPGSRKAIEAYLEAKNRGAEGRPELYRQDRRCKKLLGKFLGVSQDEIAVLGNASEGLNRLCGSFDWKVGDEVVIDDLEFPSNVLPWILLREKGVRVHVLESDNWCLNPDRFAAQINERTKLVSVSHVSYMSGTRLDIHSIGKLAHSVGSLFCVDATQSLGRITIPMDEVDYLVASTYKWMLAPHGGGIVYCKAGLLDRLNCRAVGSWSVKDIFTPDRFQKVELKSTAARLELGMPNFPILYPLGNALCYLLQADVAQFDKELQPTCDFLLEELGQMSLKLMTPSSAGLRAGIISFEHSDCERIARKLAENRVYVWGGDGRVRLSIHLYNDLEDARKLLARLRPAMGRRLW